jgi:hypothetical protein
MKPQRILIAGGPGTGKSTLSRQLATRMGLDHHAIHHTDDLMGVLEWSEASAEVARWLEEPGPWICEGVATIRALRKWTAAHPDSPRPPFDRWYLLERPLVDRKPGAIAMAKGIETVLAEVRATFLSRGTSIETLRIFTE